MIKSLIPALLIIAVLTSCSGLKPLGSGTNQVATPVPAAKPAGKSGNPKFLDDISVTADKKEATSKNEKASFAKETPAERKHTVNNIIESREGSVEKATALQLKYAILLNTDVELLQNDQLLEHIDEWYGTRYRMGGTTKSGIDCSAFVQTIYLSAFATTLPRTARDQYKSCRIISATELKEGDLVFFNTRGGISHVGIYLQNNKFVHASSSNGVIISDMFEPYYLKRYVGAGRMEKPGANIK